MSAQRTPALLAPVATGALGASALAGLYLVNPSERTLFPCPFRALTGLDCPLCGGLRMVHSALHGDLVAAADYNALALMLLPVVAVLWLVWTWRVTRGRPSTRGVTPQWTAVAIPCLLLAWAVMRNLPVEPFTVLRS